MHNENISNTFLFCLKKKKNTYIPNYYNENWSKWMNLLYCKLSSSQFFFSCTPFRTSSQLKAMSKGHFICTGTVPLGGRVKSNCSAGADCYRTPRWRFTTSTSKRLCFKNCPFKSTLKQRTMIFCPRPFCVQNDRVYQKSPYTRELTLSSKM